MRRRQRRLRSWWRHEQRIVAAALASATHQSAPRSGWPEQHNAPRGPTTGSAMEVEVHEQYYAPRGQEQPPLGVRPAPLPEVAGPQAAVTVGYVAAVAPSLAVVLVSDKMHDDAAVQFLLQQSLLARAQEEEAREQEEEGEEEEEEEEEQKKKLPKAPLPRCGRTCALQQRQVPAVESALRFSSSTTSGHSCCAAETGTHSVLHSPGAICWARSLCLCCATTGAVV